MGRRRVVLMHRTGGLGRLFGLSGRNLNGDLRRGGDLGVLDDPSRRVGVLAKRAATAPSRAGVVCHDAADYQSGTIAEAQPSRGKHAATAGESIRLHPPCLKGPPSAIASDPRSPGCNTPAIKRRLPSTVGNMAEIGHPARAAFARTVLHAAKKPPVRLSMLVEGGTQPV
jgi:hypothetical protein